MRESVRNEDLERYGEDYEGGRLWDERCWQDRPVGAAHIWQYRREDGTRLGYIGVPHAFGIGRTVILKL